MRSSRRTRSPLTPLTSRRMIRGTLSPLSWMPRMIPRLESVSDASPEALVAEGELLIVLGAPGRRALAVGRRAQSARHPRPPQDAPLPDPPRRRFRVGRSVSRRRLGARRRLVARAPLGRGQARRARVLAVQRAASRRPPRARERHAGARDRRGPRDAADLAALRALAPRERPLSRGRRRDVRALRAFRRAFRRQRALSRVGQREPGRVHLDRARRAPARHQREARRHLRVARRGAARDARP